MARLIPFHRLARPTPLILAAAPDSVIDCTGEACLDVEVQQSAGCAECRIRAARSRTSRARSRRRYSRAAKPLEKAACGAARLLSTTPYAVPNTATSSRPPEAMARPRRAGDGRPWAGGPGCTRRERRRRDRPTLVFGPSAHRWLQGGPGGQRPPEGGSSDRRGSTQVRSCGVCEGVWRVEISRIAPR